MKTKRKMPAIKELPPQKTRRTNSELNQPKETDKRNQLEVKGGLLPQIPLKLRNIINSLKTCILEILAKVAEMDKFWARMTYQNEMKVTNNINRTITSNWVETLMST